MNLLTALQILRDYQGVWGALGGGVVGWFGQIAKDRLQRQRNEIDAEQLENEQLQLALNRERFLTDRLTELGQESEMLWRRLYNREGVIKEYHSAALAARRLVNEMEIRGGVAVTVFADLPEFPPADEGKVAASQMAADERGEHYDKPDESSAPGPTSRPMGGRKEVTGQADHRPAAGD